MALNSHEIIKGGDFDYGEVPIPIAPDPATSSNEKEQMETILFGGLIVGLLATAVTFLSI